MRPKDTNGSEQRRAHGWSLRRLQVRKSRGGMQGTEVCPHQGSALAPPLNNGGALGRSGVAHTTPARLWPESSVRLCLRSRAHAALTHL
eukprot:scaffold134391_cov38-Tisochrysis_lutea.AAC.3